jgi:hypothetical protein
MLRNSQRALPSRPLSSLSKNAGPVAQTKLASLFLLITRAVPAGYPFLLAEGYWVLKNNGGRGG